MKTLATMAAASILSLVANDAFATTFYGPVSAELVCKNSSNRQIVVSGQVSFIDYSNNGNLVTWNIAQKYNKLATDDLSILGIPCTAGQAVMTAYVFNTGYCSNGWVYGGASNQGFSAWIQSLPNQNAVGLGNNLVSYHYSSFCGGE